LIKKIVKKTAGFKSSSPAVRVARDVTLLHNDCVSIFTVSIENLRCTLHIL